MKTQPACDAVGDQVVNVVRLEETKEGSRTDAESSGELVPGQVVCPLLMPEGALKGMRRKTAREIDHEDLLLVSSVWGSGAERAEDRRWSTERDRLRVGGQVAG
jgi:hypothetical protein